MELGPRVRLQRARLGGSERLTPDVKELPQGEGCPSRGLDVDDPVGRTGVKPVETLPVLEDSNAPWQRYGCPVLNQGEVRAHVELDHLQLAVDAVDGRPRRSGTRGGAPSDTQ